MHPYRKLRPAALPGQTVQLDTPCGRLYLTVNRDMQSGQPVELFCRFGKSGTCGSAVMDAMTRIISCALRVGMPVDTVIRELGGIACYQGVNSCMDSLALALKQVLNISLERIK